MNIFANDDKLKSRVNPSSVGGIFSTTQVFRAEVASHPNLDNVSERQTVIIPSVFLSIMLRPERGQTDHLLASMNSDRPARLPAYQSLVPISKIPAYQSLTHLLVPIPKIPAY